MKKQKNFQIATLSVLAFAILFMAIGFAAYSQTLQITGDVTVSKSVWNVHWDTAKNPQYTLATGSQAITQVSFTNTLFDFDCTLPEPGTFCSFTIDAVNEGTYDAKLSSITMTKSVTPSDANLDQYFSYSITYNNDTTYTQTTTGITGVTLSKMNGTQIVGRHPVTVRVEYNAPSDPQYLPSQDKTVHITGELLYDQATTANSGS